MLLHKFPINKSFDGEITDSTVGARNQNRFSIHPNLSKCKVLIDLFPFCYLHNLTTESNFPQVAFSQSRKTKTTVKTPKTMVM